MSTQPGPLATPKADWRCVCCHRKRTHVTRYRNTALCQGCRAWLHARGTHMCSQCRAVLPKARFAYKGGFRGQCPACLQRDQNRWLRSWRARHPARASEHTKRWYRKNLDYARAYSRAKSRRRYAAKKWRIFTGERSV